MPEGTRRPQPRAAVTVGRFKSFPRLRLPDPAKQGVPADGPHAAAEDIARQSEGKSQGLGSESNPGTECRAVPTERKSGIVKARARIFRKPCSHPSRFIKKLAVPEKRRIGRPSGRPAVRRSFIGTQHQAEAGTNRLKDLRFDAKSRSRSALRDAGMTRKDVFRHRRTDSAFPIGI